MAGILDFIDQKLGTRLGLLMSDPRAAIEQMNQQAGAYNQASLLATQAERNALRGLPVTPEQAAAKQYVDKVTEDIAGGFAGSTIGKNAITAAKETLNKPRMGVWQGEKPLDMWKAEQQARIEAEARKAAQQKFLEQSVEKQRLYHGTEGDISEFKPSTRGATFLSPDPEFANRYAGGEYTVDVGGAPNVIPVYAQVKKPFDPQNAEHVQNVYDYVNKYQKGAVTKSQLEEGSFGTIESYPVQQAIKRLGFDSFYVIEDGIKNIGVYDSKKIKSAIGNIGTYDITNPNILAAGVPLGLLAGTNVEMPKKQEKKPKK